MGSIRTGFNRALNPFAEGWNAKQSAAGLLSPEQSKALAELIPFLQQKMQNPDYAGAENFYQSTIENPAIENLNRRMLPAIQARGTLHSSANANAERTAIQDTMNNLSVQRGNIMESERQGTKDYMKMLLGALGIGSKENIVDKPGMLEGIFGGGLNKYA